MPSIDMYNSSTVISPSSFLVVTVSPSTVVGFYQFLLIFGRALFEIIASEIVSFLLTKVVNLAGFNSGIVCCS